MAYLDFRSLSAGSLSLLVATTSFNPALMAEQLVLEEVVVTAQKRAETIQSVPVAINAISGEKFQDFAGFSLEDADKLTAGVNIEGGQSVFDRDIRIRGLGTNLNAGISPRVTVYRDDSFVNQEQSIFLAQYDLERFEILRGPQGTLYGKASPAGALIIHTKNPNLATMEGYAQYTAAERGATNVQFGASFPLIDNQLGVRFSGVYDENSNSDIDTLFGDPTAETKSGRVVFLWEPNDAFSARLAYEHTDNDADFYEISTGSDQTVSTATPTAPDAALGGNNPILQPNDRTSLNNDKGKVELNGDTANLKLVYSWDNYELTSVSFYQQVKTTRNFDDDGLPKLQSGNTAIDAIVPGYIQLQEVTSKIKYAWNQEVRFSSLDNSFWDWMVGVYYADSKAETPVLAFNYSVIAGDALTFLPGFSYPFTSENYGLDVTFDTTALNKNKDWGIFTHNTLYLTDRTTLTAGLRYTDEQRDASQPFVQTRDIYGVGIGLVDSAVIPGEGILPKDDSVSSTAWTGTLKLAYDFSESIMIYGTYDRGWRGGSANIDATGTIPDDLKVFGDETSDNFELGLKADYWGGRAQLSSAAYYQIYNDFQYQSYTVPNFNEFGQTFDAVVPVDEVTTWGVEIENTVLLSQNWTAFTSIAYNDVEFTDAKDVPCATGTDIVDGVLVCDFDGERASNAPDWSLVLSSDYTIPLSLAGGSDWFFRGLYKFQTFSKDLDTGEQLGSFGTWDIFTGLRSQSNSWEVNLWVKNLFDKSARTDLEVVRAVPDVAVLGSPGSLANPTPNVLSGYQIVEVIDPRTFGATFTYRWF